ncbi:MAG: hypothetical protein AAB874_04225, partial [Patescibacteria group bacterium]
MKKTVQWGIIFALGIFVLLSPRLANAQQFGFNIHSLTKESPENIASILNFVAQNCQTTLVRLWGYQSTLGINGYENLQKVLDAAPANVRFIVALEDFPFGPAAGNPLLWFSVGYRFGYRSYVEQMLNKYGSNDKIAIWEVMNEAHCGGNGLCYPVLEGFIADIAGLIKSKTAALVSPGFGFHAMDFPPDVYDRIMNNMTAASCHYYSTDSTKGKCLDAAARAGGKYFYVGEAGIVAGDSCTTGQCTNSCSAGTLGGRASVVNGDRGEFAGAGADAYIMWQFSPEQNSNLICDKFSVFPVSEEPLCGGSSLGLSESPTQGDLVCQPPSQIGGGGLNPLSIIGGLLNSLARLFQPQVELDANCMDPDTAFSGNIPENNYNRNAPGKVLCKWVQDATTGGWKQQPMDKSVGITSISTSASRGFDFFLPFSGFFDGEFSRAIGYSGNTFWYNISKFSFGGGYAPKIPESGRGYMGGSLTMWDGDHMERWVQCRQGAMTGRACDELMNWAGPIRKVQMEREISSTQGGEKSFEDAWRDKTV